jgi:hypothetical protein
LLDAIKLYNLAGAHATVVACLTRALGDLLAEPLGGGSEGASLEQLAKSILEHYSKRGDVVGSQRQNLVCLLKIREATVAFEQKHFETALEASLSYPPLFLILNVVMTHRPSNLPVFYPSMVMYRESQGRQNLSRITTRLSPAISVISSCLR